MSLFNIKFFRHQMFFSAFCVFLIIFNTTGTTDFSESFSLLFQFMYFSHWIFTLFLLYIMELFLHIVLNLDFIPLSMDCLHSLHIFIYYFCLIYSSSQPAIQLIEWYRASLIPDSRVCIYRRIAVREEKPTIQASNAMYDNACRTGSDRTLNHMN